MMLHWLAVCLAAAAVITPAAAQDKVHPTLAPAIPASNAITVPVAHTLPVTCTPRSTPEARSKQALLRAAHSAAGVAQNKGPVPTGIQGAVMPNLPAHVAAARRNRTADRHYQQPFNATAAAGNTSVGAVTADASPAANHTLTVKASAAPTAPGSMAGRRSAGTLPDPSPMHDNTQGAGAATAASELTERERHERKKDEEVYQQCVRHVESTKKLVKGFLSDGGQSGTATVRTLLSVHDRRLPSVDGCRVVTVSIGFVRRMLPGGGRSGGRRLLSFSVSAWELLSDYVRRLMLRLNPCYRGGVSGGRRLLVVGGTPTAPAQPQPVISIPNSTAAAGAAAANAAAAAGAAVHAASEQHLFNATGATGNATKDPAALQAFSAANATSNQTSAAVSAAAAASPGRNAGSQTTVPALMVSEAAGKGANTTSLLSMYDHRRAGTAAGQTHTALSPTQLHASSGWVTSGVMRFRDAYCTLIVRDILEGWHRLLFAPLEPVRGWCLHAQKGHHTGGSKLLPAADSTSALALVPVGMPGAAAATTAATAAAAAAPSAGGDSGSSGVARHRLLPSGWRCRAAHQAGAGNKGAAALLAGIVAPPTGGRSGGRRPLGDAAVASHRRTAPSVRRVPAQLGARKFVRGKGVA